MRATKAVIFMYRDWPVARLLNGAVPGKRPGLRACLMLMLGAAIFCATAMGAAAPKGKQAGPEAKAADSSQFVGSETCVTCHGINGDFAVDKVHLRQ